MKKNQRRASLWHMPKIPVAGMKGRFLKASKMMELPPDLQQLIAEIP